MYLRRPLTVAASSVAGASVGCSSGLSPLSTPFRGETTGDNYSYRPGRIAKGLRCVFLSLTPSALKERIALRMQKGMEEAENLERQQMWIKTHGSPLQVMGLPDHADLPEVRARYRSLVLETHPDTASISKTSGDNALARATESEYDILQTAYRMAIDPNSLWHRNGASPVLYRGLVGKARRVDRVRVFAAATYMVMLLIGIFFAAVVVKHGLEAALQFFDPEFYRFMRDQEEEEKRKLEAGEYVDKDPKRLAPTSVRKLLFPGRYIHGNTDEVGLIDATESSTRGEQT